MKWRALLALALWPAWAAERAASGEENKAPEPFYRKYLVPGNPLDDKIVEQERRIAESPDDANLRNDFGNLLAARRFPKEAAEQYQIALKLDPKNFISAYNLGLLRETEGKVSKAMSAYQTSIKRKPGFPQSHFRLGRLYEHASRTNSAVTEYAKAMWIDPAMRDPKRNPLVVDSELIYRASLANYSRDMAVASMGNEAVYFEESRFRKLPTDRAISSAEVSGASASEAVEPPRDVGTPAAPGVTTGGAEPPARRAPRPRPTPGARARPPHPAPPQNEAPAPAAAPPGSMPAPADEVTPRPAPEPTPTPGPPPEEEPS